MIDDEGFGPALHAVFTLQEREVAAQPGAIAPHADWHHMANPRPARHLARVDITMPVGGHSAARNHPAALHARDLGEKVAVQRVSQPGVVDTGSAPVRLSTSSPTAKGATRQ